VIAGTSTGSLLAMSMAIPGKDGRPRYEAASSADAYEAFAPKIFPRERWLQIRGLVHEKYSAAGLEAALKDFLGETRLSEALVHTLVPTYDLVGQDIHVFDSAQAARRAEEDIAMRDVVRGATAAPTYFDPYVIGASGSAPKRVLIDGGLYANNPSMLALTQVARYYAGSDVMVVSLGTGRAPAQAVAGDGQDWGLARWVKPLLHIVANGTNKVIDLELEHFLGPERYFRFQTDLPEECDLDDATPKSFGDLRGLGEELVLKMSDVLDRVCAVLARP
jgi:predicted acylesterase/phospholipase RssA